MNSETPAPWFEQAALIVSGALPVVEEEALKQTPLNAELEFEIEALSEIMAEQILLLPGQAAPPAVREQLLSKVAAMALALPASAAVPPAVAQSRPVLTPVIVPSPYAGRKAAVPAQPRRAAWAMPLAAGLTILAGWGLWERNQGNSRSAWAQAKLEQAQKELEKTTQALTAKADQLQEEVIRGQQELQRKEAEMAALAPQVSTLQKSLADSQAEVKRLGEQNDISKLQLVALASKLTPKASAVVVWDHEHKKGVLRVNGLDVQKADQDYQLWMISPENPAPVSAGVFKVEKDGSARLVFEPSGPTSGTRTFAVSLEKEGGAPTPKGKVVLQGGL